jgi:hypothetical protein
MNRRATPTMILLNLYLRRSEADMTKEQLAQLASDDRVSDIRELTEPEMVYLCTLLSNLEYRLELRRQVKQIALSMAYMNPTYNPLIKDDEISKLAQSKGISNKSFQDMTSSELEQLVKLMKRKMESLSKKMNMEAAKATIFMLKELNINISTSPKNNKQCRK